MSLSRKAVVREKTVNDIDRIVDIVRSLPEWFTLNAVEIVRRDSEGLPGFVVEVDNIVRGFILLEERECCVEIVWLAVERGFQGKGLGSLLMKEAEKYALAIGKPYSPLRHTVEMTMNPTGELWSFTEKWVLNSMR